MMKKDDNLVTADRRKLKAGGSEAPNISQDEAISRPSEITVSHQKTHLRMYERNVFLLQDKATTVLRSGGARDTITQGDGNYWTTGYPCSSPDLSLHI